MAAFAEMDVQRTPESSKSGRHMGLMGTSRQRRTSAHLECLVKANERTPWSSDKDTDVFLEYIRYPGLDLNKTESKSGGTAPLFHLGVLNSHIEANCT